MVKNHCVLEMPISFIQIAFRIKFNIRLWGTRFQNVGGHLSPVVYSSSPLSYSFSEAGQEKKVVLIEAKPNEAVKYTGIPLQSGRTLHRKRFETIDNAVEWLLETHCLVELTLVSDTFCNPGFKTNP
jgi:DNA repair exonuclease SbcCD nuclease subunit